MSLSKGAQSEAVSKSLCSMHVGLANAVEEAIEVAEVYSAPRVTTAVKKMGLKSG